MGFHPRHVSVHVFIKRLGYLLRNQEVTALIWGKCYDRKEQVTDPTKRTSLILKNRHVLVLYGHGIPDDDGTKAYLQLLALLVVISSRISEFIGSAYLFFRDGWLALVLLTWSSFF